MFFKLSLLRKKGDFIYDKKKRKKKISDNISETGDNYSLILFNDEFNTFEFVIETLIQVCEHDKEQAHQCALIAHHRSKCEIKKGMKEDLIHRCSIMVNKGLSVEIISNV